MPNAVKTLNRLRSIMLIRSCNSCKFNSSFCSGSWFAICFSFNFCNASFCGKYNWQMTSAVNVKQPLVIAFTRIGRRSKALKYAAQIPFLDAPSLFTLPPPFWIPAFAVEHRFRKYPGFKVIGTPNPPHLLPNLIAQFIFTLESFLFPFWNLDHPIFTFQKLGIGFFSTRLSRFPLFRSASLICVASFFSVSII